MFKSKYKICKRCGKKNTYADHSSACPYCGYVVKNDINNGFYSQIVKEMWTHEPWEYFKVVVKSSKVMGDYIALHGLLPNNELPKKMRNKIPENEIWMRDDIYNNLERRKQILAHEYCELDLMVTYEMSYKEAHKRAEFFENIWFDKGIIIPFIDDK